MSFISEKRERIQKLSNTGYFSLLLAKALGGAGVGMLLASYYPTAGWITYGWLLIVIAFILGIPAFKAAYLE